MTRTYKNNPNKLSLFFTNDLSKYHEHAYNSEGLSIKIVKKDIRFARGKLGDAPTLIHFLDEIGCKEKDGTKALNSSKLKVDYEISNIVKYEYLNRVGMMNIKLAVIRSIKISKKERFTAHEISIRNGIRPHLKVIKENDYLSNIKDKFNHTHQIEKILDGFIEDGHTVKGKEGDYYIRE